VKAAVEAARSLPFPFQLTARAENLIQGRMDLVDTIRRLEAFAEAGANVLYAPGLRTPEEISAVIRAVAPRPVNVLMGLTGASFTMDDLARLGVKRVSVGSLLARSAYGAFLRGAEEIRKTGTFGFAADAVPFARLNELFQSTSPTPGNG
jgi:2-methylisocitrate lyase-like PEP mutase family enzyme